MFTIPRGRDTIHHYTYGFRAHMREFIGYFDAMPQILSNEVANISSLDKCGIYMLDQTTSVSSTRIPRSSKIHSLKYSLHRVESNKTKPTKYGANQNSPSRFLLQYSLHDVVCNIGI